MTAQYSELMAVVARRAHVEREQGDAAVRATLQALAECVDAKQVRRMLPTLPPAFGDLELPASGPDTPAEQAEFLARVAERDHLGAEQAERRVWGVLAALDAHGDTRDPLRRVLAAGGADYEQLLPPPEALRSDAGFLAAVRERGGFANDTQAREALAATLNALGRELSEGEAADLREWLPESVRDELSEQHHEAEGLARGRFVRAIATHRELDSEMARVEARAVLSVVRDAAPETEIRDALSQLPDGVTELLR